MLPKNASCLPLLLVEFSFESPDEHEMDHYDLYDVRFH